MAVQQNSLKYFGGQQSGNGEAKLNIKKPNGVTQVYDPTGTDQTVDISAYAWLHGGQGNDSDPYKCNSRLYSPTNSGTTNFSVEQVIDVPDDALDNPLDLLSLVSRCYDEDVKFVNIRYNDDIYWLTSYSPDPYLGGCLFEGFTQSISIGADGSYVIIPRPSGSGGDQFVLVRTAMATAFSNQEYQDCMDAVTAGKAVCLQFSRGGIKHQAQLTSIDATNNLIFELDSEVYHFKWEVDSTNNNHMITERIFHFGTPIFKSLQDAISESDSLEPGMYFETNGFNSSGDGGAGRYYVSSSGTANGKNVVQLDVGKNAFLQYGDWVCPEELGYNHSDDVVPYITFIISTLNIQHIKLKAVGTYHWKSKLTLSNVNGFEIVGEGDWGYPRKFTYINVDPTSDIGCMMELAGRSITLKNLDIEVTGSQMLKIDGITSESYADGAEFYFNFDNLRMNSFKECWRLNGGIKWHMIFNECQPANCKVGVHFIESSSMLINMKEVYFNHCADVGLWFEGNVFTAKMDSCNFGSMDVGVKCSVNSAQYLYQNLQFNSCNFEDDNVNTGSRSAVFFDCYDASHLDIRQNITISNSNFTLAKSTAPVQDTTNRYFRLGKKTNILFINNQILGMNEPDHPEWVVYPKLFWNTSVLPTQGSVIEVGNNLFFDYPNEFLPYVVRNGQSIGVNCYNAKDPTETAWTDCNTFFPRYSGEMRIARVSTYESTANMPTTGIFGYLMAFGVLENPNPRVLQVLFASNNNIYTRVIRDTGGGWTALAWKTITAS